MHQPDQFAYSAMSLFVDLISRESTSVDVCMLVNCYGLNGIGVQAIELYRQMSKELIDEVTYVCVLNACSHSELVDEARSIFQNIQIKTGTIYCTMV